MGSSVEAMPPPGNQLIDEQVSHARLELVEGEGEKKGRVFARGEFGHASKPTSNGRLYRSSIWENNISRLRPNLEARKVLGELDHPTDGRTALQRASHVVTALQLEGSRVVGEAEILDTAKGRDLKAILAAGVPVGISSRGFGSTKPGTGGIEEVQDDYKLVTFDFVAEPADSSAYPEIVYESGDASETSRALFEGFSPEMETDEEEETDDSEEADEGQDADEEARADEERAPQVAATTPEEQELAKRFVQQAVEEGQPAVSEERLREEFTEEIVTRLAAMRTEVEQQVRAEMEADPEIVAIRQVLEHIRTVAPTLQEVGEGDYRALRDQLDEAEATIAGQQGMIERLTDAAREAGYRYHLECLLHEDDSEVAALRAMVGDVTQYESPKELQARVEAAREELEAIQEQEEQERQRQNAEVERLQEKVSELAEGLERALESNHEMSLQLYAARRLQTHPQGAKILRMLERSGASSREQVDQLIEAHREPARDADDLEAVRARVRSLVHGGQEYLAEENQPARRVGRPDYNGLGASLADLRHLAGMRG